MQADKSKRNAAELSRAMASCHDAVMILLKPNVREHNWVRWQSLMKLKHLPQMRISYKGSKPPKSNDFDFVSGIVYQVLFR